MARPVNINGLVNDIMYKYDHNKNGVINLQRPEGFKEKLKNPDERVRSKTSVNSFGDDLNISTSVYTQRDLFYAADKNNDGEVTREELTDAVKKFDTNGDGEMTGRDDAHALSAGVRMTW